MQDEGGLASYAIIHQAIHVLVSKMVQNIINIQLSPNHNRYKAKSLEKSSLREHLPAQHYAHFTKQDKDLDT